MKDQLRVWPALRQATADCHARIDSVFSTVNLADREDYGRFLRAQASAHIAVESALDDADLAATLPDWPMRRRAGLLRTDLAALGLDAPATLGPPAFADAPAMLGAAYVLEGSRLGGTVLKRSLPAELPAHFLGAGDSAGWRGFIEQLDQLIQDDHGVESAISAARNVFILFERGAQRFLRGVS
jgi:heme oxygenase